MTSAAPNACDMTGLVHRPDSFVAGLLAGGDLERVGRSLVSLADSSFRTHPMRGGSKGVTPEWRRRRDFLVVTFRELQGDLGWTTDRALSVLRSALAAHLDGRPWKPAEQRMLWAPDMALAAQDMIRVDDPALAPPGPEGGVEALSELDVQLDDEAGEGR